MNERIEQESMEGGAHVRLPPPAIFVAAAILGAVLDGYAWPLEPPAILVGTWANVLAGAAGLAGLVLIGVPLVALMHSGQAPQPWLPTPELLSGGIYGWSRNPMYLGMGLLQLGVGLWLSNLWIVALVPCSLWVVDVIAIRPEEAYLEAKFGSAYAEYKRMVRRWI